MAGILRMQTFDAGLMMRTTLQQSLKSTLQPMPKRIQHRSAHLPPAAVKPARRARLRRHRINEPFDKGHERWPEMTQYAHDGSTHELRLFRWNPTIEEVAAVSSGEVELGFEDYTELCYLKSRLTQDVAWSRTPIARWLLPHPTCPLPASDSPLRVVLINAADGKVQAIGILALDASIVIRLHQLFTLQAHQPSSYLAMDDLLRSTRSVETIRPVPERRRPLTGAAHLKTRQRQPQRLSL